MTTQGKLSLRLVPLALVAVALMTWLSRRAVESVLTDEAARGLESLAASFAQTPGTRALLATGDESRLLPRLQELARSEPSSYSAVLDAGGRVLAHTDVVQRGTTIAWPATRRRRIVAARGRLFAEAAAPIRGQAADVYALGEREPVLGWVVVGASLEDALRGARRVSWGVFVVVAVIMTLMSAVASAFLRRTLAPVAHLADATRRLGAGELGAQAPPAAADEIGDLTRQFNDMSRRLAEVTVSKGYLDDILQGMLEGLVVAEPGGAIRMLNRRALELLGGSQSDWAGRGVADILPAAASAMASGGRVMGLEGKLSTKDKGEVPVLFGVAPVGGPEEGFAVTFADIAQRVKAEQDLAEKVAELARSNRELEQFAYVASHDLQEPLRKIANFTQLLERRYRGKLGPDADQFIFYIVDGTLRMRGLIQGLLAFSRAGRGSSVRRMADMKAVVRSALSAVELAVTEADAVVEVGDLPPARGDAERLAQVFQNLIGNALKFRHADRRAVVKIGGREDADCWTYWVEDNGLGIEPQYREKVFAIFQRLHPPRTYPGTGIGLAICRRIVEMHGGRIWIEDGAGGTGCRFVFTLSKRAPNAKGGSHESEVQGADGRGR